MSTKVNVRNQAPLEDPIIEFVQIGGSMRDRRTRTIQKATKGNLAWRLLAVKIRDVSGQALSTGILHSQAFSAKHGRRTA